MFGQPHHLSKSRGEDLIGVGLLLSRYFGTHFAHRHCDSVATAFGVGHQVVELGRIGSVVAVPDVIQEAFAWLQRSILTGDQVARGQVRACRRRIGVGLTLGYALSSG